MNSILSDRSKFKLHTSIDPLLNTLRCEDRLNRFLRKLKVCGAISQSTYEEIFISGSSPGTLYGLPKVHKTNIPLRPILSAYITPNYKLAKHLASLLNPLSTNIFTIKNSYEFANEITSLNSSHKIMYSFDVESLFTNIPLNEVIEIVINKIFQNSDTTFHNFTKIQFKQLLELAIKNMFFIFNKQLYEQIDGVAMGSPLAPVLANIFLSHHEENWLQQCPNNFKPLLYKRYVDDTFLLFEDTVDPNHFLNYLNSKHPNIRFTAESETNNQISFLDMSIHKQNNSFHTSVFRKKTFTGLGTNYFSSIPFRFKIASISTLVHRAYHLSSTYCNFHIEIKFLTKFFNDNFYPPLLLNKTVNKFLARIYQSNENATQTVPKQKIFIKLPYYGYITDRITTDLKKLFTKHFPQLHINFICTNSLSIQSFFRHKERLPDSLCSSIIYKFECLSCNALYLGSTRRQFSCRVGEHRAVSIRTNRPLSAPPFSAVREHSQHTGHPIQHKNFKIVATTNNADLHILESLYIKKLKPSPQSN